MGFLEGDPEVQEAGGGLGCAGIRVVGLIREDADRSWCEYAVGCKRPNVSQSVGESCLDEWIARYDLVMSSVVR